MAITLDASSTPASTGTQISFTHTAAATVRCIVVSILQNVGSFDEITSVTWAGIPMNRLRFAGLSSAESGAVYTYMLGSSVPTGLQSCVISVDGTGSIKRATLWSLNAAADKDLAQNTIDSTINSASQVDPSVTLALAGRTSWCTISFMSGQDDPTGITPLANWTATLEQDFGTATGGCYRYNTVSNVDVVAGWTQTAEDARAIALALYEVPAVVASAHAVRSPPMSVHGVGGAGAFH